MSRRRALAALAILAALAAPAAGRHAARGADAAAPRLTPVRGTTATAADLPPLPRRAAPPAARLAPVGARPAQGATERLLETFEDPAWPARATWPLVTDLAAIQRGAPGLGAPWAPSPCAASEGARGLRAAADGRDCAAGYPPDVASSALLSLDLSDTGYDRGLALSFDVWMEADPDEGLLVHYVRFDDAGATAERRLIWSGTGRIGDWVRGVSIDLTDLRDAYDARWSADLRGRRAYIEWLFLSRDGAPDARGAAVDRIVLARQLAPPSPTPTPAPTRLPTATAAPTTPAGPTPSVERTNACGASRVCRQLAVRAYVDYRCDGRYQPGVDSPLRGDPAPRLDVTAGADLLGTSLSASGTAIFLYPAVPEATVRLALPEGYVPCPGVQNPARVPDEAFRRGRARLDFRLMRW